MNNKFNAYKSLGIRQNVCLRVIDSVTGDIVQEHVGHNMATNTLLLGIAHYLTGDGVLNQGSHMLSEYVPKYISLGTMGLITQNQDSEGLPSGIGVTVPSDDDPEYQELIERLHQAQSDLENAKAALGDNECCALCEDCPSWQDGNCPVQVLKNAYDEAKSNYDNALQDVLDFTGNEEIRISDYMKQRPGYGADGYDEFENNSRKHFGLGPVFSGRPVDCELISKSFPREDISFRDIVPEIEAELPQTIDVVFSAMISVGALKQFREDGKDYVFITECGLWSKKDYDMDSEGNRFYDSGENGLLAAYRIAPTNEWNWEVNSDSISYHTKYEYLRSVENILYPTEDQINSVDPEVVAKYNRDLLKKNILRVGVNQVVQVIWKIQLGSIDQFSSINDLRKQYYNYAMPEDISKCPYCGQDILGSDDSDSEGG